MVVCPNGDWAWRSHCQW